MNLSLNKFGGVLVALALLCNVAIAQFTASGTVKDGAGKALEGVSVIVKGTTFGTITDAKGGYAVNVPNESGRLVFSSVGYAKTEKAVAKAAAMVDVVLLNSASNIDEIVISGFATTTARKNLANAVGTVSSKELTGTTTVQTVDGALYGKFSGANIVANSGAPGGGISVKLRGVSTINGSTEPLYIIDGVYMDNSATSGGVNIVSQAGRGTGPSNQDNPANRMADLNPDDIERIEILKGPSAAAIYGTRANAGVVLITTKKGKAGKTKVSITQDLGQASILNPLGLRNFDTEAKAASVGQDAVWRAATNKNRDYEMETFGNKGFIRNTGVNVSSGNDKTQFYISGNTRKEDGIVKFTGFNRNSLRLNIDHKINDKLDVSVNTMFTNSSNSRSVTGNDNVNVSLSVAVSATYPFEDLSPNAQGIYPDGLAGSNVLQTVRHFRNLEKTNRFVGGGTANYTLLKTDDSYLKLRVSAGVDNYASQSTIHSPEFMQFEKAGPAATFGKYVVGNTNSLTANTSAFLLFNKKADKLDLNTSLGVARYDISRSYNLVTATKLVGGQTNLEQGTISAVNNRSVTSTDIGFVAQQEANYDDKYIATLGIRADKSTLFGNNLANKLFFFPKASLAVNLSGFDFLKDNKIISQLKARVAYGQSGGIPQPGSVSLQQPQFTVFGSQIISGDLGLGISTALGNGDVRPERASEIEGGLDLGLFNNKISLDFTVFNKTVTDFLLTAQLPPSTGFSSQVVNGGKLVNKGIELGLRANIANTKLLNWDVNLNFWTVNNKMVELNVPQFTQGSFGTSFGTFLIDTGFAVGSIVGRTLDASIEQNDGIKGNGLAIVGTSIPKFQMSWLNTITIAKNIDFTMLWHWKKGGDNINLTQLLYDFAGTTWDFDEKNLTPFTDAQAGKTNGDMRLAAFGKTTKYIVQDASFVKLREVAVYYTLPKISKNIDRIRIGASANNVLLFTKYQSYDPEVSNFGSNGVSTGVDVNPFPSSKRIFGHINIDF